jgi:hypothetical protein
MFKNTDRSYGNGMLNTSLHSNNEWKPDDRSAAIVTVVIIGKVKMIYLGGKVKKKITCFHACNNQIKNFQIILLKMDRFSVLTSTATAICFRDTERGEQTD